MMRSLYSGITGLRNHQTRMDVIGNNISNVNTVGFKSSRTVFQDLYSQTLSGAAGNTLTATGGLGGTNPKQIGLGVTLASIDVIHTPGANQYTGALLDVAINGDGFFVIENNGTEYYSRAGNFYTDNQNYLVTNAGNFVRGFAVNHETGVISNPLTDDDTGSPPFVTDGRIWIDPIYENVKISDKGIITGYNPGNQKIEYIAVLQMATFANNTGLEKVGGNLYMQTSNSGVPEKTTAGQGKVDPLSPGALEMSNVDLAEQFVDMIVTQRGFQANSRTITVSDTMLEELINLKR